jgi:hypothetical protein
MGQEQKNVQNENLATGKTRYGNANLQIVAIRGQLTAEMLVPRLVIEQQHFAALAAVPPYDASEHSYYSQLWEELEKAAIRVARQNPMDEPGLSRQIAVANRECISFLQLLLRPEQRVLFVAMRSSSTQRLPSDLGFYARVAMHYNLDEIVINFGSLHVELTPRKKDEANNN